TAGTGTITFTGTVGNTRLSALSINSAGGVTANNLSAASFSQLSGTGTTVFNGSLNTTGNISLTGAAFSFNSGVTAGGSFSIANSGILTMNGGAVCSVTGPFTQTNIGAVTMAGQITAAGISFTSAMTLSGNPQLTSTGGTNDIALNGAVDGGG